MSRVIYVTPSITLLINVYVNAGIELSLDTTLPIREDRNFRYWIRNGQNHSLANSFSRIGPKYRDGRRNCTFVTLFFQFFLLSLSLFLPFFSFFPASFLYIGCAALYALASIASVNLPQDCRLNRARYF